MTAAVFVLTSYFAAAGTGFGYADPTPLPSGSVAATDSSSPAPTTATPTTPVPTTSTQTIPTSSSTVPSSSVPVPPSSSAATTPAAPPVRIRPAVTAAALPAVVSSPYVTLTATSLDAVGLAYTGTTTVPSSAGNVQALRFTMTSGSIAELTMTQVCTANFTTVSTAPTASLGSTTFDAVSLTVTVGGATLTFTPAAPPTSPFPAEVVLQNVTLSATTITGATLTMPSFATQAAAC